MQNNINIYGCYTLYKKEVWRFLKVYHQTLFAPIINSLLLLTVFILAFKHRGNYVSNIGLDIFIASGLIMMTTIQNAFANTSSSLVSSKVIGHVTDFIVPPMNGFEKTIAMSLAGVTRGVLTGVICLIVFSFFIKIKIYHIGLLIFFIFVSSLMLSLIGLLCGIMSNSFEGMAAMTSYIINPLSLLSGTFFSISNIPPVWQIIAKFNPFFYMIDGTRYAITGYHDSNITIGIITLTISNIILLSLCTYLIQTSYKLKS